MKRADAARTPSLMLEFDPDAAEEKALVRLRQAAATSPSRLYALRSGGAVLEVLAACIGVLGVGTAAILMFGGTGDVLDSPRPAVAGGVLVMTLLAALVVAVAGQLLSAQAAVAQNTRLMTSILAEMNHTITATASATAPTRIAPVVVSTAVHEAV